MKRTEFSLRSVKPNGKGLVVTYNIIGSDKEHTDKCKDLPHPDYSKATSVLRPLLTEVFGMIPGNDELFEVRGVTLSSRKSVPIVLITSMFETPTGAKTCLNTPNIDIDGDDYDGQEELQNQLNVITDEVYRYLFEGKAAQLQVEFPEDDIPEEDGPVDETQED